MPVNLSHDAIDDWLHVGSYPSEPADILHLSKELGVTAVVNLQSDADFALRAINWQAFWTVYTANGMAVERVPIQDFMRPDLLVHMEAAVETVRGFRDAGCTVYLHCNAGVNRSPTVAIGYYALHGGLSVEDAAALVQGRRRCLPYLDVVERWLAQR
jgi:atypical dual specificity phosphatase